MTEQEFTEKAREIGIRDENILTAIEIYKNIKNYLPKITLKEMLETTLQIQTKNDNETDDFLTVD